MTKLNNEAREMAFEELEQVSGGSLLNRMLDKAAAALGARLLDAVRQPLVTPAPMTLHMR